MQYMASKINGKILSEFRFGDAANVLLDHVRKRRQAPDNSTVEEKVNEEVEKALEEGAEKLEEAEKAAEKVAKEAEK